MSSNTTIKSGSGLIGMMSSLLVIHPTDLHQGAILAAVSALSSYTTVALLRYAGRLFRRSPTAEPEPGSSITSQSQNMHISTIIRRAGRDARTGRFVSIRLAKSMPDTTVIETSRRKARRSRRGKALKSRNPGTEQE